MPATRDELFVLLQPVVAACGPELVDLELRPGLLRLVVDRPGGVDLDTISDVTRSSSRLLDERDPFPGGRYRLEVSSPGLERPLRSPTQFERAVGETITVRIVAGGDGPRRLRGRLLEAGPDALVLDADMVDGQPSSPALHQRIPYDQIERARTVFEWGATAPQRTGGPAKRAKPARPDGADRVRTAR